MMHRDIGIMVTCEVDDLGGAAGEVGRSFRGDAGGLLRVGTGPRVERVAVEDELVDVFEQGI